MARALKDCLRIAQQSTSRLLFTAHKLLLIVKGLEANQERDIRHNLYAWASAKLGWPAQRNRVALWRAVGPGGLAGDKIMGSPLHCATELNSVSSSQHAAFGADYLLGVSHAIAARISSQVLSRTSSTAEHLHFGQPFTY